MAKYVTVLLNLGTPETPEPKNVRRFLKEFLSDPYVIDLPFHIRWLLLHAIILPFRTSKVAKQYHFIWTREGSPLLVYTRKLTEKLQAQTSVPTYYCMRYSEPGPKTIINHILNQKLNNVLLFPLFPQFSICTWQSAVDHFLKTAKNIAPALKIYIHPPYWNQPAFHKALVHSITQKFEKTDYLLFSFHGLPVKMLKKTDPTGNHCLTTPDCCFTNSPAIEKCYRAQSIYIARKTAELLEIDATKWSFSFQSRFGLARWLEPSTNSVISSLPGKSIKNLTIIAPSFATECLETLYELDKTGQEIFKNAGGSYYNRIPCLNDSHAWVNALAEMLQNYIESSKI